MQIQAKTPEDYLAALPDNQREPVTRLREILRANLPPELEETMAYGMITYVVPHAIYPPGYHVDPRQALPFVSLAAQKNHIALYHMALYALPEQLDWLTAAYEKTGTGKLDMGKSCIRFKPRQQIPYDLIAELCHRVSVADYINVARAVPRASTRSAADRT
ncbi:MAG: DUF1801 domain-containing protein [Clostridia bacterium]|nr:DUF1801 domain-containing protein [Clostridia bacterium]NCC75254.1 DUF1801 domain-containing protein [Clostridia bacterium]